MKFLLIPGLVVALLATASAASAQAPKIDPAREALGQTGKTTVLVVSGNDPFHRWKETTPLFRSVLEGSGRFEVRVVEDPFILESAAALQRYQLIIFNQQTRVATPRMRENLSAYIKAGGGLLAFHWAIDTFSDWPEFAALLGRVWREGTSGEEHGTFQVTVKDRTHPVTRKLADFRTGEQEAIHFDLAGDAPVDTPAMAFLPEAKREVPILYLHAFGKGRVAFTPLGHSAQSRDSDGFRTVLLRAAEWCATGDVIEK